MAIIIKTLAVLAIILSFTFTPSNGYEVDMIEVLALAEKLTDLFKAISNTKISLGEQQNIFRLQGSLMTAWRNILNALNNIESSKTIDVYIALIKNHQDLVRQLINVFNVDQLIKFSVSVADTINSVNEKEKINNCSTTDCIVSFQPNNTITTVVFTVPTTLPTKLPTTRLQNTTSIEFITNMTTLINQPVNTTATTSVSTTLFNTTLTTITVASNSTKVSTTPNTTILKHNTTMMPQNLTTIGNVSNLTSSTSSLPTITATIPLTQNQVYIDSEFCQFYTLSDCASRIEISLLCPAMCRCSKFNCKNNGTLALSDDGQCKCLCRPEFTGDNCDEAVCTEKEYCSYFNDSYCTVTMIEDNCPALCGKCKK